MTRYQISQVDAETSLRPVAEEEDPMDPRATCPLCGGPKRDIWGGSWAGWACRDCQNAGGLCFQCGEQAADDSGLCPRHQAQANEDAALRGDLDNGEDA